MNTILTQRDDNIPKLPAHSAMDLDVLSEIKKFCKMADEKDDDSAFLIFDIDDVVEKVRHWRKKMPRVDPFYAMKSNSDPMLLKILAALGVGFDCASKKEIETIITLGVPADRIVYANTCKVFSHLQRAAELKVELMTFDSKDELLKIKQLSPSAKLLLRLKVNVSSAKIIMNDKFGCHESEIPHLLEVALQHNLSVVGISFHAGSGVQNPDDYASAIAMCRRAFDTAKKKGIEMHLLDIGGGFPGVISSQTCSQVPNFDEMAVAINKAIDEHFRSDSAFKIISEPGRYFAKSAYTLCTKIVGKKQRSINNEEDTMYIINEGIYGLFLHIIFHSFQPVVKEMWPGTKARKRSSIWGYSCDPIDLIVKKCLMPELQVGDWIVFEGMGAYRSSCSTTFNGFEKTRVKHVVSKKTLAELEEVVGSKLSRILFEATQLKEIK